MYFPFGVWIRISHEKGVRISCWDRPLGSAVGIGLDALFTIPATFPALFPADVLFTIPVTIPITIPASFPADVLFIIPVTIPPTFLVVVYVPGYVLG